MSFQLTVTAEMLSALPSNDFLKLGDMYNAELAKRYSLAGPLGKPGLGYATKDQLVERYGLDGRKLTGRDLSDGYTESMPKYLLSEIPFNISYNNDEGCFSWIPEGKMLEEVRQMFRNEPHCEAVAEYPSIEFLIHPHLQHYHPVSVRETDSRVIHSVYTRPLKWLVEWYAGAAADIESKKMPAVIQVRPTINSDKANILDEFNGQSLSIDYRVGQHKFEVVPIRVGYYFNMMTGSILSGLLREGAVSCGIELERKLDIRSIYVQVGNNLVRMMTDTLPRSTFCPSSVLNGTQVLELEATCQIRKGNGDAFTNKFEFDSLMQEGDVLFIKVKLAGEFNPETGLLIVTAKSTEVTSNHESEAVHVLAALLKDQTQVLAVEPVGYTRNY